MSAGALIEPEFGAPGVRTDPEAWLAAARSGGLPTPERDRWQPLRVGISGLWEYDETEFWFADGRLVLRGGNGAGKTKVLELTTLMLLRGEIAPAVLDPFGSQHRTMRFNLLPSGEEDDPRPPADSGIGYAWAEFGRLDDRGAARYLVCGLAASARRGSGTESTRRWMFLTERRPGAELLLAPATGALEEKELRRQPGVRVFDNATRYRAALADELFGLDPDSFDNLTDLLKQLRRPKLGERLNPSSLAETLRDALPPLATTEVTQLAEGWDRLEALRRGVEQIEHAAAAVADFTRRSWLPWSRLVVRRHADELRAATTKLDDTTRERRTAQAHLAEAEQATREAAARREERKRTLGDTRTELRTLLDSPAYQDAVHAAERAERLRGEARSAESARAGAAERLERAEIVAEKADRRVGAAEQAVSGAQVQVQQRAGKVRELAEPAGLADSAAEHLPGHAVPALLADHERRTARLDHLRTLRKAWREAHDEVGRTAPVLAEREAAVRTANGAVEAATRAVTDAAEAAEQAVRAWAGGLRVAAAPSSTVESWVGLLADPRPGATPLADALSTHLAAARNVLHRRRAELAGQRGPLGQRHDEVSTELAATRTATETPPPPPALWARRARPAAAEQLGAPLWRCVQPRGELDPDTQARLEAALAAAGLLDAWLTPDGAVLGADGTELSDTLLAGERTTEPNVLAVLEPTPAGGVAAERIGAALAGIGWGARLPGGTASSTSSAWVAADGRWRLGPLTGRAEPVQPASYLGATAREQARARRIAALQAELDALAAELAELDAHADRVDGDLAELDVEAGTAPDEQPVLTALDRLELLRSQVSAAMAALAEITERLRILELARDRAWAEVSGFAAEHRFPLDDLDEVTRALAEFGSAVRELRGELNVLAERERVREHAAAVLGESKAAQQTAGTEHAEAAEAARRARIAADAARRALGQDQRAQLDRRSELDGLISTLDTEVESLGAALADLTARVAKAQAVLEQHTEQRAQAAARRDEAAAAWWSVTDAGLVGALEVPVPETHTAEAALGAARAASRTITVSPAADAEEKARRRCDNHRFELREVLLPNRDVTVDDDAALPVPRIVVDQTTGALLPPAAADALAAQAAAQRRRYDDEQQRVLTTLLGSTFIEHLKDRLDYTEGVLRAVNVELAAHPTRQGHALRLVWQPHPDAPEAARVVEALQQGYEQLAEPRQEMVRAFLARRIEESRADAASAGLADWQEHLAGALDYRQWLRIQLQFRPGPHSSWRVFDAARHGSKSGGEKVVLLSQPLFAAAKVGYDAAGPHAPRMVWLDEAMTGVDEEYKASFMGLTVRFDLDVMLTAHDEWCTYRTVPSVAVYDLARARFVPGVDVLPYLWCGERLTELAAAPVPRALVEPEPEGLFTT